MMFANSYTVHYVAVPEDGVKEKCLLEIKNMFH